WQDRPPRARHQPGAGGAPRCQRVRRSRRLAGRHRRARRRRREGRDGRRTAGHGAVVSDVVTAITPRMPWDDYLALPGVSITRLKELGRSPQHYRYRRDNPKESAPLTLGRAAHCAVLEPERYERDHAVW